LIKKRAFAFRITILPTTFVAELVTTEAGHMVAALRFGNPETALAHFLH